MYTFIKSKTGEIIPAINNLPLHSTVDPKREAQKLLTAVPEDTGFIIFLGLGGGFAPLAALEETEALVAVIDYNKDSISAIKHLLESKDYSALLENKRFTLLIDPSNEEIQDFILSHYKPAICGGIKVLPLRTRVDFDKEAFNCAAEAIQQAITAVSSDYSVQTHFGKRWFCNILRNLANMNDQDNVPDLFSKKIKSAAVAAAGPSLDLQINELAECKDNGSFIISSDTALGALLHNGIIPDAVVSIDCQYKSYYHFLGWKNQIRNVSLIMDIASPPSLNMVSSVPFFFASGHPFAHYISENFSPLPVLDTSGGNVTYACFSFAQSLGAENIILFGADFAYINSQTYARGTYVNPYFDERQNRFKTLETQSSIFMYRSPFLEPAPDQMYRETAQLRFYRECLEKKAGVKIKPGSGIQLQIPSRSRLFESDAETQRAYLRYDAGLLSKKQQFSSVDFLKDYRNKIINSNDQNIITTLLPYAAFLKHRNPQLKSKELLSETRKCCVKEIEKIIELGACRNSQRSGAVDSSNRAQRKNFIH